MATPTDLVYVAVGCEQRLAGAFFGQPANTVTAFMFVVAGLAVLAGWPATVRHRWTYGLLVVGVGVGSVVQHGPYPDWQAYAHDLPLAGVLAFVAVDSARDLLRHELSAWWWVVPTVAVAPALALQPSASMHLQLVYAVVAVGLGLLRIRERPRLRRYLVPAIALLAFGGLIGTLGERTALCQPESLLQGHAVWHVLAAAALWWLAPAIGAREPAGQLGTGGHLTAPSGAR